MLQGLRTRTNLILLVAFVLALTLLIVLLTAGPKASKVTLAVVGATSKGDQAQERLDAITTAARDEVNALFAVDYRHLDAWQVTLTNGSTGDFLSQLQAKLETNKAAVYQGKIVATVDVFDVGINALKPPDSTNSSWTAVVYASANESETSPTLKGIAATASCAANTVCHRYVLKLGLIQTPGGWKVSSLGVAQ